jgi:glutathione S-transferase
MTMCIRERVDAAWSRRWCRTSAASTSSGTNRGDVSGRRAFLCGAFSIADCFYAPVAYRFQTYGVEPEGAGKAYLAALLAHPLLREWEEAALAESVIVEADEPRYIYRDKLAAAGRL